MSLWDGFMSYNYTYQGNVVGTKYNEMLLPRLFHKQNSLSLELNQNMFIYDWQKNLPTEFPIKDMYVNDVNDELWAISLFYSFHISY